MKPTANDIASARSETPDRAEFLSRQGHRLHFAERLDSISRFRARRRSLALLLAAVLAAGAFTVCRGQPVHAESMVGRRGEALMRAHELARSCPWPGAQVNTVPGTMSMWPTLDQGCYVVMARKPWGSVQVGDITAMVRPGRGFVTPARVLHRLVASMRAADGGTAYLAKGDNNLRQDPGSFTSAHYVSTVYAVVRFADVPHARPMTLAVLNASRSKR